MNLLLLGSRDFSRTVFELVAQCGHLAVGRVDDFCDGPGILGTFEEIQATHPPDSFGMAMAIGYSDLTARRRAWERIRDRGYATPALVHPRAYVADSATVGEGAIIMAGAIVDSRATIGDAAVIWPGSCVNHDATVEANVFLSPSVTVCGHAVIGSDTFIGAGSVVVDHGVVPRGSFIRMMTAVTRRSQ